MSGGGGRTMSRGRGAGPSLLLLLLVVHLSAATFTTRTKGDPGKHDNAWCFRGVYDYDNCPDVQAESPDGCTVVSADVGADSSDNRLVGMGLREKGTLLACVRCCSELKTYYEKPPSKNVCLAACADRFPKLGIEWIYP